MREGSEVLVIGAGVVGIATAYALARRGLSVTIVDRATGPASGTSFANGAQLSYAYTDALASPGMLRSLPQLLLAAEPAFRLRPSVDPDFFRWGLAFLRNCTRARFRRNTLDGLQLGIESHLAMHALLERHPLEFGHSVPGKLHLLEDEAALDAARGVVAMKKDAGIAQEIVDPGEALRLEPALAERSGSLSGAVYSPQEEVGDPYRFCTALLDELRTRYGVRTRFGSPVQSLSWSRGRAAAEMPGGARIEARGIAVCTGIETPAFLKGSGIRVPIWPMKGYSFTAPPGRAAPRISVTDVKRKVVFCNLSGQLRVAGLADLGNRDTAVNARRLGALIDSARGALPLAADYEHIDFTWSGLRPMTPTSLPVIRRERGGVVLNVGHGALGWTYAMGAGERVAALMTEN